LLPGLRTAGSPGWSAKYPTGARGAVGSAAAMGAMIAVHKLNADKTAFICDLDIGLK
jgi:hypothetical protein